ncbi:MAG: fumarylacetoacetate hydrolase family protein [Rubricella sp.]
MPTLFAPPPTVLIPIANRIETFPVRRVYCVGRNYAEHAREMGHDPDREPPFFFQKNPDDLVIGGGDVPYPTMTRDLHHEVELVVALHTGGGDISETAALDHVFGYAVGVDLTRRDLQGAAKKAGRPWEVGKAFDASGPIAAIHAAETVGHPDTGAITLSVNGETRQAGDLAQLIWSVPEVIARLSQLFTLAPGDLIFTGTPAGVGQLERGDAVEARIEGLGALSFTMR